jgi:hypothetical protein
MGTLKGAESGPKTPKTFWATFLICAKKLFTSTLFDSILKLDCGAPIYTKGMEESGRGEILFERCPKIFTPNCNCTIATLQFPVTWNDE